VAGMGKISIQDFFDNFNYEVAGFTRSITVPIPDVDLAEGFKGVMRDDNDEPTTITHIDALFLKLSVSSKNEFWHDLFATARKCVENQSTSEWKKKYDKEKLEKAWKEVGQVQLVINPIATGTSQFEIIDYHCTEWQSPRSEWSFWVEYAHQRVMEKLKAASEDDDLPYKERQENKKALKDRTIWYQEARSVNAEPRRLRRKKRRNGRDKISPHDQQRIDLHCAQLRRRRRKRRKNRCDKRELPPSEEPEMVDESEDRLWFSIGQVGLDFAPYKRQ